MNKGRESLYFILENVFYYTLVLYVFLGVLGVGESFLEMNIHPLLLLTGIMSYRYGVHKGVISGTIASLVYIYVYVDFGNDLVLFFHDFAYFKFLLMFYIVSFIMGRIKDNHLEKIVKLTEENQIALKNYKKVHANNTKLVYLNNRLKSQITGAEKSIITLYSIAKELDSLDTEAIVTNIMDVMRTYVNAEVISFYKVDSTSKNLVLDLAVGGNRKLPDVIKLTEYPEFEKVIKEKKYGKRDGKSLKIPVFYAPILDNEKVIGVLNIERLNYESYTTYTEKMFEILISWMNRSITNAVSFMENSNINQKYKNTDILYFDAFEKRRKEEEKRKELFNHSYIFLKFNFVGKDLGEINLGIRMIDRAGYDEETKTLFVLIVGGKKEEKEAFQREILQANLGILEVSHEN